MADTVCSAPICHSSVYSNAVTASLRDQLQRINLSDVERRKVALQRMKLPPTLALNSNGYKTLRDATLMELQFPEQQCNNKVKINDQSLPPLVQPVRVLRGRDVIQRNLPSQGSIGFAVRRPG
jgi:hypothetical protein